MMPPSVLLPMEARLGEFHLAEGELEKASAVLLEGLKRTPNDWELLSRLKVVLEKSGETDAAKEVAERIRDLSKE